MGHSKLLPVSYSLKMQSRSRRYECKSLVAHHPNVLISKHHKAKLNVLGT